MLEAARTHRALKSNDGAVMARFSPAENYPVTGCSPRATRSNRPALGHSCDEPYGKSGFCFGMVSSAGSDGPQAIGEAPPQRPRPAPVLASGDGSLRSGDRPTVIPVKCVDGSRRYAARVGGEEDAMAYIHPRTDEDKGERLHPGTQGRPWAHCFTGQLV